MSNKTKLVKLEMVLEISDGKESMEEIGKLEHHVEYLLDLDSYPEIIGISGVKVTELQ